jgi:hypothetical protein
LSFLTIVIVPVLIAGIDVFADEKKDADGRERTAITPCSLLDLARL